MRTIAAVLLVAGWAAVAAAGEAAPAVPAPGEPAPMSAPERALLRKVESAEKAGGDLTAYSDLFGSKDFVAVYRHPQAHLGAALALLARPEVSETRKTILVLSMQKLPKAPYLAFLDRLLELETKGKISRKVFADGAFPTYDWNSLLADEYKDPKVVDFLTRARAAVADESVRAGIDGILSGKAAEDAREDREMRASKPK